MAGTTPVLDPSWSGTQPPACLRNPRAWGDDLFGAVSDDPSPLITPRKRIQGKPAATGLTFENCVTATLAPLPLAELLQHSRLRSSRSHRQLLTAAYPWSCTPFHRLAP